MKENEDWRLQGQDEYLVGETLVYRPYRQNQKNPNWDHDHCEFCWATFMIGGGDETLSEGYATLDDYRWICKKCFTDFLDMFKWKVVGIGDLDNDA